MLLKKYILSFLLFISTFSFLLFLYTVSWRHKRDYPNASVDILFYIMFYIINKMKKHQALFIPRSYLQYQKGHSFHEISFISRLDCTFYNKFRLVYIVILIKRGKLGSAKQQKEVIMKKRFGISRIICEISLVVKKRLYMGEKEIHDLETDSK